MLMTAAVPVHMMDSGHGHSSSPPPWLLADDDNTRRSLLIRDDLVASSAPSPSQASATAAAPTLNHHHDSLRPAAARRVSKRRPRPSRKLPTTYIAADPASFRHMVHQVTGADHLLLPVPPPPGGTLCRPAPSRGAAGAPAGALTTLPTLDTSAFLLLGAAPSVVVEQQEEAGGVAGVGRPCCDYGSNSGSSCGGGAFPTLDSWDPLF